MHGQDSRKGERQKRNKRKVETHRAGGNAGTFEPGLTEIRAVVVLNGADARPSLWLNTPNSRHDGMTWFVN
jgi:hypothetical protein